MISFSLYAVALILFIFIKNPYMFYIASAIYGLGHGINIPSYLSILSTLVPKENLAGFMSLNRATALLGQTAAPFFFGLIYKGYGIYSVFIAGIISAVISIVIISFLFKQNKFD